MPAPESEVTTTTGQGTLRPRHYVENMDFNPTKNGLSEAPFKPGEKTLCGALWDRLNVEHNGAICQACVDELRRRGGN